MDITLMQSLQDQLTTERQNAAIYDALSGYADNVNYSGTAKWMQAAADDERKHAALVAEHLIDRGFSPVFSQLSPVDILPGDDLLALFEAALALEFSTTERIITLFYVAQQCEDPQTLAWLQDADGDGFAFLIEQTKSEREIRDILMSLRRVDKTGWEIIDRSL